MTGQQSPVATRTWQKFSRVSLEGQEALCQQEGSTSLGAAIHVTSFDTTGCSQIFWGASWG